MTLLLLLLLCCYQVLDVSGNSLGPQAVRVICLALYHDFVIIIIIIIIIVLLSGSGCVRQQSGSSGGACDMSSSLS